MGTDFRSRGLLRCLAAAPLLLCCAWLDAEPRPAPASAGSAPALALIEVSARRQVEPLQSTPLAVTALSAEALDRMDVDDLGALDALVPNLTLYAARGSSRTLVAYLRGIGQSDQLWGVEPGVGVYLDDVYLARPQGALLEVFDVERIEVLRGPQGTLYGKNTLGGAIKYVSAPLEDEGYGWVEGTLGSYRQSDAKAGINQPLGGGWVARLALASLHHAGYGRNRLSDQPASDEEALAARLLFGGNVGDTTLRFSLDGVRDRSAPPGAALRAPNRFAPEFAPLPHRYDHRSGMGNRNDVDGHGFSLSAQRPISAAWDARLVVADRRNRAAGDNDLDMLPLAITDVAYTLDDRQRSAELQLSGDPGGRWRAVAGLFVFAGDAGGRLRTTLAERSFQDIRGHMATDSIAAFGEAIVDLAPRWTLSLGARYTEERKRVRVLNRCYADAGYDALAASCNAANPMPIAADFRDAVGSSDLSPRINLAWQVAPQTLYYLQFARGFKSGGFNIRAQTVQFPESQRPFDDERVDSLEAGLKWTSRERNAQANVALFGNRYREIQLSVFTAFDSDGDGSRDAFFGDFTNAGRGRARGAELELQLALGAAHRLDVQAAWLDTRYDEYRTATADGGTIDIAGQQRFSNAPRHSAAVSLMSDGEYAGHRFDSRVTYSWQDATYPTTDLSEALRQGAYGLWSAQLRWDPPGPWSLSLSGENLGDRRYRTTGYLIEATGVLVAYHGAPRTVGLSLRHDF